MRTVNLPQCSAAHCGLRTFHSIALLGVALLFLLPTAPIQGQTSAILSSTSIPDRIVSRVDDSSLATIQGSTHPAIRHATDNGRLSSSAAMGDLILVLTRSAAQQAALESFNKEQYDPSSPEYHHWLTPEEFGATFGVSQSDLNTVSNWLQDHGFTIDEIPPSHTSIRFSGSVAQVETAFHTEMHAIQSNGVAHVANTSDIQIPAALIPVVAGVKALHNFFPKAQHHALSTLSQNSSASLTSLGALSKPGSQEVGAAGFNGPAGAKPDYNADGYQLLVPYDMATIYNYKSLWTASAPITGTGQTIAIAGTSNIVLSDVATFRALTGLPANVPRVIVTNSDPGTTALLDDRFENTLDVEWSGGAAPGASIVLVTSSQTSQTTDSLYASESYIINNNIAKIMSVSYGECELWMGTAGNQEYLNLWQQAYSQGIAVFVSSGDSAAAVCDDGNYNPSTDFATAYGPTVSGMTSTPYNVSVGGTDFALSSTGWGSTNSGTNLSNATGYIPETPWNDTVTNPFIINMFNSQQGVNDNAEQWANWLLKNGGIYSGNYDSLIPPVGGSGGVSNCTTSSNYDPSSCGGGYAKPAWQTGVTGILSTDKRTVPDVSFFASAGFMGVAYLICDTQPPGYNASIPCSYPANALDMAVGGTSVSSPVMAGVMALINQKAGSSQGNPNAQLYALAAKQTYSNCSAEKTTNSSACYFNDIDTGTIATPCFAGSVNCTAQIKGDALGILPGYAATTGYDKATGLGSLNVANVVNGWPATSTSGPAAVISPASLNFAPTVVSASSATQTVTLTNSGTSALTISAITINSANTNSGATVAAPFAQTNTCGATLAAKASCVVTVTFKPTAIGAASATLGFADNAPNSPQTAALTGFGATSGPGATLSPTTLTFPSTTVGTSSSLQNVTLTNTGNASLTLSTIAISNTSTASKPATTAPIFAQINNCGASLASGATCTVSVIFSPTAAGAASATLTFTDNAASSPQTVSLIGTGAALPAVSATISPTSLIFPSTSAGSASAVQTVTFTNTGSTALASLQAVLTGTNASLFKGASGCSGSLAAGSSCIMNYTFNPNAAGSFSATLSVDSSTSGYTTLSIPLSGVAVAAPAASFSPTSLTFPSTAVGSSAATQSFTLTNTGGAALALTSIVTAGTNPSSFIQNNNCGTINAGASCVITVTFKPAAAGALSATLSFTDNAANSPQAVTLSGTGTAAPAVTLTPSSLTFASTNVGATAATQAVTLKNTGTATLTLSGISISSANSIAGATPAASFTQTNTCAATLAAGASCVITVAFKPASAGALTAALSIADNVPGTATGSTSSIQTVALSGTGVGVPAVTLSPISLAFPSTGVGASSNPQFVTLTNTGTGALTISSISVIGTNASAFTQTNACGSSLAVSAACTIAVTFKPATAGTLAASLSITDNAPSTAAATSTQNVALSGAGVLLLPAATLSVSSLSFPITAVSTANLSNYSPAQTITLTNTGTAPLTISSIKLGGSNPTFFNQMNNCPGSLPASAACTALVRFASTTSGAGTATLVFTDNASSATQSVSLSGSAAPAPAITISSTALSFGSVTSGTASAAQAVTLTNTSSTTPLNLSSIALSGTGAALFAQISNCGITLAPGSACIVLVEFVPTAKGAATASLAITTNNPGATASVALTGTGN
ncbi:MAG: choice-of-anchor D domain-containing protein [Terracidiphilus sp.]|jgi:hypothetical protein